MFPSTDSPKNAVDMFPRTDTLKWHSFYPLKPCCNMGRQKNRSDKTSCIKTLSWKTIRKNLVVFLF